MVYALVSLAVGARLESKTINNISRFCDIDLIQVSHQTQLLPRSILISS